jgi:hypothetical protein
MNPKTKQFGRRAFLRGLGATIIGLPLLELTHGKAWAADPLGAGRRFITVFSHGGDIYNFGSGWPDWFIRPGPAQVTNEINEGSWLDWWSPPQTTAGPINTLGPVHEPLVDHKDKLLIVRGIDNKAGLDQGTYGGGHSWCNVSILTAAKLAGTTEDTATSLGKSIDFVIAERLAARFGGRTTPIHLLVDGHNYGSPYFRGSQQRQYGEENPRTAFASLFAGVTSSGAPDPAVVRAWAMKKSVLDGTVDGFASFSAKLGTKDREIVDAHLQHIRELEVRLIQPTAQCTVPAQPPSTTDPQIAGPLHVDLILAGLRCGLMNVANLEIADILTPWAPSGLQVESGYNIGHSLHHMARDVGPLGPSSAQMNAWALEMKENRQWRFGLVKRLLDGLANPAFMEGANTMLDNSLVYCTSEFSRGESHNARDTLCLLAGSAGNYFNTGRYLNYNTKWQADPNTLDYDTTAATNNLFVSFLNAFGEPDTTFGAMEHSYRAGPLAELR